MRSLRPCLEKGIDRLLGTAPDDEIARQLGRTRVAVTDRRCALGIASANANRPAGRQFGSVLPAPRCMVVQRLHFAGQVRVVESPKIIAVLAGNDTVCVVGRR
jgi:hypothetical protein